MLTVPGSPPLFHSLLPSSPLCDFVPGSILSPPSLPFPCLRGKSFDLLQRLTWRTTRTPDQPVRLASAG